jgi:ubiquinone/menaquinone biosynthesis C-methylase UbiE
MDNNLVYEWILPVFTASERAQSVQLMAAHLSPLLHSGSTVLDLCCGGGPASFWFEEMGAVETALDFAPYMISLAKGGCCSGSSVTFIEADVFL